MRAPVLSGPFYRYEEGTWRDQTAVDHHVGDRLIQQRLITGKFTTDGIDNLLNCHMWHSIHISLVTP